MNPSEARSDPLAQPIDAPAAPDAIPTGDVSDVELSRLVSTVYGEAPPALRARLLECLIGALRPLGLVAVAAGAFGVFVHREPWDRISVSLNDALRFSSDQVGELARFVEQVQPEALDRVAALMADNPACLTTLSGALLLMALRLWVPAHASANPVPTTLSSSQ